MRDERQTLKDSVYLNMAKGIALLSKDKDTKIGAVIVARDGSPVSWGYNGTLPGLDDDKIPHSREEQELCYVENGVTHCFMASKYPFMQHAEENAIDFGDKDKMAGATIYVTGMPCLRCAGKIAKRNIARVVIPDDIVITEGSTIGKDDDITKFYFSRKGIILTIGSEDIRLWNPDDPPSVRGL